MSLPSPQSLGTNAKTRIVKIIDGLQIMGPSNLLGERLERTNFMLLWLAMIKTASFANRQET